MATTLPLIGVRNFGNGEVVTTAPVPIPTGVGYMRVELDRSSLPADRSKLATVEVDLSLDGGLTWSTDAAQRSAQSFGPFPVKLKVSGGQTYGDASDPDSLGQPLPGTSATATTVPLPRSTSRLCKARLVALGAMRSRVNLTLSTDGGDMQ